MEKTIEIHSESIHDETVVFEHVSSGMGPDDDTEKRTLKEVKPINNIKNVTKEMY